MTDKPLTLSPSATDDGPSPVGRPRLLTREAILDAALELGLEALTMKRLAAKLGTGAATLYQYFDNRDALLRAAALHAFQDMHLPCDTDQHWTEFARDHARIMQAVLVENPSAISHYVQADYGFEVQIEMVEHFLATMQRRSFSAEEGMVLLRGVTMASMSGAMEIIRERAFLARGTKPTDVLDRQLAAAPEADFPLTRSVRAQLAAPADTLLDQFLEPVLQAWLLRRGEQMPE